MNFNGLEVLNRVIASSAFKYGSGFDFTENPWGWLWRKAGLMSFDDFGAVSTKTITLPPNAGNYVDCLRPWKVIRIYLGKVFNRVGWSNCGFNEFISKELPKLGKRIKKLIVNIGALNSIEEIFTMLRDLNDHDIAGVELNISCHNRNLRFLDDPKVLRELFRKARAISRHAFIVKINAESDYVGISKIAQEEGINLIHAINTTRVYSKAFKDYCGQSSYKNKEIALKIIRKLRSNGIWIPIIGGSGIWTLKDIKDYENAGANLFSMSHQFIYAPFWPGILARRLERREK